MESEFVLQGKVMWSYGYELAEFTPAQKLMAGLSGMVPLHNHKGYIALSENAIIIEGQEDDEDLTIPLTSVNELYLGFDDLYTAASVKNAGLFWQPLRIEFYNGSNHLQKIYLIIDYIGMYTHNKKWYEELISVLQ